jgi:hypothetical protein
MEVEATSTSFTTDFGAFFSFSCFVIYVDYTTIKLASKDVDN